jgi:hypothetical protein
MDPHLALLIVRLEALSLGLAVVGILSPFVGFWILLREVRATHESIARILRGDDHP